MPDVQNWDSGGNWDSGLQFDVNDFPSTGDVEPYLDLITSEHRGKANFIQVLTEILQPLADGIATLQLMPSSFDIDNAVGDQLDIVGKWIGRTREFSMPLENVYFSFGVEGLGFGQGAWKGRFDPTSGLVSLPDSVYRTYLRAVIAANHWDGTIPGAYAVWAAIFENTGLSMFIVDGDDMTIKYIGLVGAAIDAPTLALLTGGYLNLKPAGVRVRGYITNSVPGTPIFGFGSNSATIGGFGVGSWMTPLSPT